MKNNMLKIGSFAFLFSLGLTSCNSEAPAAPQSDAKVIDLNNFSFAEVKSILKSGTAVVLKDGESEIPVSRFTELQGETADADGGKVTSYQANDSVSVSLAKDFASIKVGNSVGYAAYADAADMQTVTKTYADMLVATKAAPATVTRSASGQSMRIDIHAAIKANAIQTNGLSNTAMANDYVTATPEEAKDAEVVDAKTMNTKGYGDVVYPRKKVVTIYLLIGSNACKPIPHELVWQQEAAQRSVNDIFSKDKANAPKLKFVVDNCEFKSTENSETDLVKFKEFIRSNPGKYYAGGRDIFFLVRYWGWGFAVGPGRGAGRAWVSAYNINRFTNEDAFGVSATTCLYPYVLSHELGHIFGVNGHSSTPWYKLNKDVMNPCIDLLWVNEYHRTDIKEGTEHRDAMYKRLKEDPSQRIYPWYITVNE